MRVLREVGILAADLVLGRRCAGCDSPGLVLCATCAGELRRFPRPALPRPTPSDLPQVFATTDYAGIAREVILAHKEHARLGLAGPLGHALAASVVAITATAEPPLVEVALVPVPSRAAVVRARGHDPLARMTRVAARVMREHGIAADVVRCLRVRRRVADQAGLDAGARAANVSGAFALARIAAVPAAVVVVDDVLTTGSTATEATRVLTQTGTRLLGVAVVAATTRARSDRSK